MSQLQFANILKITTSYIVLVPNMPASHACFNSYYTTVAIGAMSPNVTNCSNMIATIMTKCKQVIEEEGGLAIILDGFKRDTWIKHGHP
jgi:hypothetical protein